MPQKLYNPWKYRDEDDTYYDKCKVVLDGRDIAEHVSSKYEDSYPGHPSYDIITDEAPI